jgi:hypothetical protein
MVLLARNIDRSKSSLAGCATSLWRCLFDKARAVVYTVDERDGIVRKDEDAI